MKKLLEDIKLRFEAFRFMLVMIPIFIEDYKRMKKIAKTGDPKLQEKLREEWMHNQTKWTRWPD